MGKGDIKTKRGKITNGSFGKLRKHKVEPDKPKKRTDEADENVNPKSS